MTNTDAAAIMVDEILKIERARIADFLGTGQTNRIRSEVVDEILSKLEKLELD